MEKENFKEKSTSRKVVALVVRGQRYLDFLCCREGMRYGKTVYYCLVSAFVSLLIYFW